MKVSRRNLVVKLGAASVAGAAMSVAALPKAFAQGAPAAAAGVVNVYSARHYGVEGVFETFTRETGIRVRFTFGTDAGLRERIRAEGRHTPADMFIGIDAGNLVLAATQGLLQPVTSLSLIHI